MAKKTHTPYADNLTAKKSLGQHFLHDEKVCTQIVAGITTIPQLPLLEIGPGPGAITKYLVNVPDIKFTCIELDKEKVDYLNQKYPSLQGHIIHDDFLDTPMPYTEPFSIVGNFPYNISTQIIFKVLDWRSHVQEVVGMFQKEVALRFASQHGSKEYGITSVVTQAFYDVTYLFDVPPTSFTPPPNVQSAVIRLINTHNKYDIADYKKFKSFVKIAFAMRRKTLRNCFKSFLPAEVLSQEIFNKRAEQLSVQNFVELYKAVYM